MPRYVAGRPPAARPGLTTYKLSSNENPYPPLPGVLDAAVRAASAMNRYPDIGTHTLYEALSAARGVPVDHLAAGTGSTALLYGLLSAFCEPGDEVVYPWRSFEGYPIAVLAAGAASVQVSNLADGRHDVDGILAALTPRTRVVMLCSPNNPTGSILRQDELDRVLAAVPGDVLVILDEAYAEFVREGDAADGLATYPTHPNLVVLRTFSKAYGLAGLRVGYAVAAPEIIDPLRAITLPFGVSAVAEAAAVASLAVEDELFARVDALVAERARILDGLHRLGWEVPDAHGNFVWFALSGDALAGFVTAAEDLGVAVRGLGDDGVRVSIGEREANDRILALAQRLIP
jgi:histidinol-phosphate aminotransferase